MSGYLTISMIVCACLRKLTLTSEAALLGLFDEKSHNYNNNQPQNLQ